MNCPTCGAANQPNAAFCSQCATNLLVPNSPPGMGGMAPPPGPYGYGGQPGFGVDPSYYAPMPTRTSGMAIAGFVLSFFCSLLGLIFSAIGYSECKKSGGSVTGGGLAIAGIIISLLGIIINFIYIAAIFGAKSHY